MGTANFNINAEDGWVAVTAAGVSFIRIRSNTPNHAFYVTTNGSLPASTVIGYKVTCEDFWCDVTVADNFYVRIIENLPQNTRIDVFSVASAP